MKLLDQTLPQLPLSGSLLPDLVPWPAAPCLNSESLSRPLSPPHFFAAARHNTHHDLLPPTSLLPQPPARRIFSRLYGFCRRSLRSFNPLSEISRRSTRSEPLRSLLFFAFSPGLPRASPLRSPCGSPLSRTRSFGAPSVRGWGTLYSPTFALSSSI